jgi:hypothetical protein
VLQPTTASRHPQDGLDLASCYTSETFYLEATLYNWPLILQRGIHRVTNSLETIIVLNEDQRYKVFDPHNVG